MHDSSGGSSTASVPPSSAPPGTSAVCTLFEGHYHLGFGALANSLSTAGFQGKIFAGYRGPLPPWSEGRCTLRADGTHVMPCGVAEIVFVPVDTPRHLTNLKPEFMLDVWSRLAPATSNVFYFDPDMTVLARWSYFETWVEAGVAVVMDGNTPLPSNHPLRVAWRKYFEPRGFKFSSRHDYHFNGGFVGVNQANRPALEAWRDIQTAMSEAVPFHFHVGMMGAPEHMRNRLFPFFLTDQDALNVMADLEGVTLSPMGGEGMGWKIPAIFMTHALGSPKPWLGLYLRQARRGHSPGKADEAFWNAALSPVPLFSQNHIQAIRRQMKWAAVVAPLGKWLQSMRALFSRDG